MLNTIPSDQSTIESYKSFAQNSKTTEPISISTLIKESSASSVIFSRPRKKVSASTRQKMAVFTGAIAKVKKDSTLLFSSGYLASEFNLNS